jgi:acetyl-CoA acetyltransferase
VVALVLASLEGGTIRVPVTDRAGVVDGAERASWMQALHKAGVAAGEIAYWEINEAFSVVDLANQQLLQLDPARWVSPRQHGQARCTHVGCESGVLQHLRTPTHSSMQPVTVHA